MVSPSASRDPSPPTQNPDETSPLLHGHEHQDAVASRKQPSAMLYGVFGGASSAVRLTPAVFLAVLGVNLPVASLLDLIQRLTCILWYWRNDPERIPTDGDFPLELCFKKGPSQALSIYMSAQALALSLAGFFISSFIAQYSSRIGRKPILCVIISGSAFGMFSFFMAFGNSSTTVTLVWLAFWQLCEVLFNVVGLLLVANIMVTDTTKPEQRTFSLSLVVGAISGGTALSLGMGGWITAWAGSARTTVLIAFSCSIAALLYTVFLIPESFGSVKVAAARVEREERETRRRARSAERWINAEGTRGRTAKRLVRKGFEGIASVFEPLGRLIPDRKPETGALNMRLPTLAAAAFLVYIASGYLSPALVTYMLIVLQTNPKQSGQILSLVALSQVVGLMVIFPSVIKWGRPLYIRRHAARKRVVQPESEAPMSSSVDDPNQAAHFDIWLLMASLIADALALFAMGLSNTKNQLTAALCLLALGVGTKPTLTSAFAASVEPIVSGEALSALAMISNIAGLTAPILLGYFAEKTVSTAPSAIFYLMSALVAISALLTLLVRDEDRYIQTHSTLDSDDGTDE